MSVKKFLEESKKYTSIKRLIFQTFNDDEIDATDRGTIYNTMWFITGINVNVNIIMRILTRVKNNILIISCLLQVTFCHK